MFLGYGDVREMFLGHGDVREMFLGHGDVREMFLGHGDVREMFLGHSDVREMFLGHGDVREMFHSHCTLRKSTSYTWTSSCNNPYGEDSNIYRWAIFSYHFQEVPEGVSKINQEETPGRGVITFQAIENSTSQPILQTSDSDPYSGVELQPWTFQWHLTL